MLLSPNSAVLVLADLRRGNLSEVCRNLREPILVRLVLVVGEYDDFCCPSVLRHVSWLSVSSAVMTRCPLQSILLREQFLWGFWHNISLEEPYCHSAVPLAEAPTCVVLAVPSTLPRLGSPCGWSIRPLSQARHGW